jgi:thioredoxin
MKKLFILTLTTIFATAVFAEKPVNSKSTTKDAKVNTIHLTKEEFLQKVVNYEANSSEWKYLGDKPCLIDFYADWCGPCKIIAPILEELAEEYKGDIYIYKINTDKEQELAYVFGIRSIPSLLFCPMGENPQMVRGALPKNAFKQNIDEILLKKAPVEK